MKTKKITLIALLLSMGIVLQIFESNLPVIAGIPGGKLGFANIVTILCINLFDIKTSFLLSILRPLLSSLLYGGITQLPYSLSGSVLSFIFMALIIKNSNKLSYMGAAVIGAMAHNLAQVTVAVFMYSNIHIYKYLPPLFIISIISGYFTGFCSTIIIQKYKKKER